MARDGIGRALAFVTSAYSSYSGCRQYLEDIERARQAAGAEAPVIDKLRAFWNHPGFIEPMAANVQEALDAIPLEQRPRTRLAFTGHSIPLAMAETCDYEKQLRDAARLVADRLDDPPPWQLVYQSRSGPPSQPWLEPDVVEHIEALAAAGVTDAVVVPIGFLSDHMEVVYDLDTKARARCEEIGVNLVRAGTVGTAASFVAMIRELVLERLEPDRERRFLGTLGPRPDVCPPGCCPPPARRSV
jgi:ferrochelatase